MRYFIAPTPEEADFPASSANRISLPCMGFLELEDLAPRLTNIFTFLRLPSFIRLWLCADSMRPSAVTYAQQSKAMMLQVRLHILRNPTMPPLFAAVVDWSRQLSVSFSHTRLCPYSSKASICLQTRPKSQPEMRQMLKQIANFLPLEQLRSLDALGIDGKTHERHVAIRVPFPSMQTWRTLLRLLPYYDRSQRWHGRSAASCHRHYALIFNYSARNPSATPEDKRTWKPTASETYPLGCSQSKICQGILARPCYTRGTS